MSKILIPHKYSRIAHFTSLFILQNANTLYSNNEKLVGILCFLTYIFTNFHWYKLKDKGTIRSIDIFLVVITFFLSFFRAYNYDCFFDYIFFSSITISGFSINEYFNFLTLYSKNFEYLSENEKKIIYIRSVLIHTFFLHVFHSQCCIYVVTKCQLCNS